MRTGGQSVSASEIGNAAEGGTVRPKSFSETGSLSGKTPSTVTGTEKAVRRLALWIDVHSQGAEMPPDITHPAPIFEEREDEP